MGDYNGMKMLVDYKRKKARIVPKVTKVNITINDVDTVKVAFIEKMMERKRSLEVSQMVKEREA